MGYCLNCGNETEEEIGHYCDSCGELQVHSNPEPEEIERLV